MTPDLARVVLTIVARGAPFIPMTAAEAPLFMQAMRELEAEAAAQSPPPSEPPDAA
jgi:hypothetical protein